MIRTLLTTTAIAALLGSAVIAQDTAPANNTEAPANTMEAPAEGGTPDNTMAPGNTMEARSNGMEAPSNGMEAPSNTTETPSNTMEAPANTGNMTPAASGSTGMEAQDFTVSEGYVIADGDNLVSRLMGMPVYSSAGDDAEEFGTINDLVFDEEGRIVAVIIGVGGFLGIGEKQVAVDFSQLEWTVASDNTERWVLPTTREELETAPDFVWEEEQVNPAADPAMAPADQGQGGMAPADQGQGGMAPADQGQGGMTPADPGATTPPASN